VLKLKVLFRRGKAYHDYSVQKCQSHAIYISTQKSNKPQHLYTRRLSCFATPTPTTPYQKPPEEKLLSSFLKVPTIPAIPTPHASKNTRWHGCCLWYHGAVEANARVVVRSAFGFAEISIWEFEKNGWRDGGERRRDEGKLEWGFMG